MPRAHWLEPVPDARALPAGADPSELAVLRESIRLAFVAALQSLPPRQRAVLLLTDVLGCSAAEVADSLDSSVAAVNSALQRARATMAAKPALQREGPLDAAQAALVERYVDAFHRYDVDALTALLHEDATMSMPPYALWLRGPAAIAQWLRGPGQGCEGSRLVPTAACGSSGIRAVSRSAAVEAWGLVVLEVSGDRIAGWNTFLDTDDALPTLRAAAALV